MFIWNVSKLNDLVQFRDFVPVAIGIGGYIIIAIITHRRKPLI